MAKSFLNKGSDYAIAILVVGLMIAFLLPVAITPFNEGTTNTLTQTEGVTYDVNGLVTTNATDIDGAGNTVNVTLNENGTTASTTNLAEGSNTTLTMPSGDIIVTNENVSSDTEARLEYEYDTDYGWGSGASQLFGLIPLMLVLVVLLLVVYKARQMR